MTMRGGERERGAMQLTLRLVRLCVGFRHTANGRFVFFAMTIMITIDDKSEE